MDEERNEAKAALARLQADMEERAEDFAKRMVEQNAVLGKERWAELLKDANGQYLEAARLGACVILEDAWSQAANSEEDLNDNP